MHIEKLYKRLVKLHDTYFNIHFNNLDISSLSLQLSEILETFISLPPVHEVNELVLMESSRYYIQELLLKSKGLL